MTPGRGRTGGPPEEGHAAPGPPPPACRPRGGRPRPRNTPPPRGHPCPPRPGHRAGRRGPAPEPPRTGGRPAPAVEIPYYRMDSLAFLASDIVLVDEVRHETRKDRWGDYPEATVTVVRALKGSCQDKDRLTVALDGTYTRIRVGDAFGDK